MSTSSEDTEGQLNAAIQERLHFMPKLIESSMAADKATCHNQDIIMIAQIVGARAMDKIGVDRGTLRIDLS